MDILGKLCADTHFPFRSRNNVFRDMAMHPLASLSLSVSERAYLVLGCRKHLEQPRQRAFPFFLSA